MNCHDVGRMLDAYIDDDLTPLLDVRSSNQQATEAS